MDQSLLELNFTLLRVNAVNLHSYESDNSSMKSNHKQNSLLKE